MSKHDFDVIIVGARCAGAPTGMLLARQGYKVLIVDRASFPSDTLSTHVIQPHGVARLARWGLLDRVIASGCPPIHTYAFHFGPLVIAGSPGTPDANVAYCPRRTVLDKILADAAVTAGAELREGFVVDEVLSSDGQVTGIRGREKNGPDITITAPLVVGADGRNSIVARSISSAVYNERPTLQGGYYAYWSGVPLEGRFEIFAGEGCGAGLAATNDGLTMIVGGWPLARYATKKHDHEKSYRSLVDELPALAERIQGARIESRVFGGATPNFFRKPFGRGWALAGDAGYVKDPITAQGITDAFRDAELLATAVHEWRSGARSFVEAMSAYQASRDAQSLPMYELTCQLAAMDPPPPELVQLLQAASGNQTAMDQFCRVNSGVAPPAEFFDEDNVRRIFATAGV